KVTERRADLDEHAQQMLHLIARRQQLIELLVHPANQPALAEPSKSRTAFVVGHPTRYLRDIRAMRQPALTTQRKDALRQLNPDGSGAQGFICGTNPWSSTKKGRRQQIAAHRMSASAANPAASESACWAARIVDPISRRIPPPGSAAPYRVWRATATRSFSPFSRRETSAPRSACWSGLR